MNQDFEESLKQQQILISERLKTVKNGENIIHIDFHGEIDENVLREIERIFSTHNLELSYYNKSGILLNTIQDFSLDTMFVISYPIIKELIFGVSSGALWDIIKYSIKITKENLSDKKLKIVQASEIKERNIKFGVKMKFDKNTQFDFELSGELDDETFSSSLDKILDFIKDKKFNNEFQHPKYIEFKKEELRWIEKDFEEFLKSKNKK